MYYPFYLTMGTKVRKPYVKVKQKQVYDKKTREKVLNTIKDYYTGLKISDTVRNIPINQDLYRIYFKRNEEYIDRIYEKYNMKRYYDKWEFMKSKEAYELTDKQKEALWIEYEYRDKLIRTGQYDEYRIELFRDNYLKGMRRLGATEKEIETLRSMSLEQWDLLQDIPQPSKDNAKDKILPPLGLFNYNDSSYLSKVREDLQLLLKEQFNIEYEYEDISIISKALKHSKTLLGSMDKLTEDEYESYNEVEKYNYMITHVPDSKIKVSKPDRYGHTHFYIKGVGSETGKNSQLIKDIIKAKGK